MNEDFPQDPSVLLPQEVEQQATGVEVVQPVAVPQFATGSQIPETEAMKVSDEQASSVAEQTSEGSQPFSSETPDNSANHEVPAQEPSLQIEPDPDGHQEGENSDNDARLETPEQESQAHERAKFSVAINRSILEGIQINAPSAEEGSQHVYRNIEATQAAIDAKVAELSGILEKIKRLPEHLDFQPGITLIVGENGGGKSTLGRALQLVAEYHDTVKSFREFRGSGDDDSKEDVEKSAFRSVFETKGGSKAENLGMAGLGAYIAPAMLEGTTFLSGSGAPYYMDVGEILAVPKHLLGNE